VSPASSITSSARSGDDPVRIGIVAGEPSGDILGAGLIAALKQRLPQARFEGICGPRMQALGCQTLHPMESISLLGFEDLLGKIRGILKIRRELAERFAADPPDVFVGVDVPDFNIGLEAKLKSRGIPTVHYVSPTVWAWRGYRIGKISRAVDHMLTLFPFEAEYYRRHHVPVTFVGHPMADEINEEPQTGPARRRLGLAEDGQLVALLPGSRRSELRRLAGRIVATANWLQQRHPDLRFVVPLVNEEHEEKIRRCIAREGVAGLNLDLRVGHSRDAMAAADVVLLASGTAALEAALVGRPMVVTYRLSWLSYFLIRLLAHVRYYSMPNNLAGRELVPELIQGDAVPEKLGRAVEALLEDPEAAARTRAEFAQMHDSLRGDASRRAADVVLNLLHKGGRP
jgi:lipid-A-disaccharide synthase